LHGPGVGGIRAIREKDAHTEFASSIYEGTDGQLKSTYLVAPGADPSRIRWRYQGANDVQVDAEGNLLVLLSAPGAGQPGATATYTLTEQAPVAWQTIAGQRVAVDVRFRVTTNGRVSFALGSYDTTQPLTIDPTLTYSTYLGGNSDEFGNFIAVDSSENIYVTGYTYSSNFPTANAAQSTNSGYVDTFVAKFDPTGSTLLYSTYVGGNSITTRSLS